MSRGGALEGLLGRPVTVLVLLVTLVVLGVIANARMPRQLMPSGIVLPTISVMIPVPDSTPQEVMERVAVPAEEWIRTIPGISSIRSISGSSFCRLRVEFSDGADAQVIYADIRDRMERLLPDLPEGADRYRLFRFDLETDVPVISCAASYDTSVEAPDALLENVVAPRLESIEGVARVEVQGLIARQVAIELIPERISAHAVDVMALINRLSEENIIAPGGALEDGGTRTLLRVTRRFDNLDALRAFRIDDSLLLGDIAEVFIERGVQDFVVRVDGRLCKIVRAFKESDANAVDVTRALGAAFDHELARDPRLAGFDFHVFWDAGEQVTASLSSLRSTCAWGGLLAIVVLFVFLRRWRSTVVVAAAIPVSLLLALVAMEWSGSTLNALSMMGLTIAIGMLIDNAIVVSETIFRRRERGEPPARAAIGGAHEVALAVTLATLTTVAVFVPLIFLGSDSFIGAAMAEVGSPICFSLIASLFVALIFIPTGTIWLCPEREVPGRQRANGESGGWGARPPGLLRRQYRRALAFSLRHRLPAFLLLLLAAASANIPRSQLSDAQQEGDPSGDQYVRVDFPRSSTLADADAVMEQLRRALEPLRAELRIETIAAWFNSDAGTLAFFLEEGVAIPTTLFHERIGPHFPDLPGVEVSLEGNEDDRKAFRIEAVGRDPRLLAAVLRELAEDVRDVPGVLEVTTPADESSEEIAVVVDRERAGRYAISAQQVSSMVGWMIRGAPLPDFREAGEDLPVWIRFQEQETEGLGELSRVEMFSPDGRSVPLTQIARFDTGFSVPAIRRHDRRVSSRIQVVFESGDDARTTERNIAELLVATELPDGVTLGSSGGTSALDRDRQEVARAGMVGFILIFLIMGVLFESLLLPLAVLCSVPFLFVGSYWSCWLLGENPSPEASIGYVILLGVVVNNAIVLVDCIRRHRRAGKLRSSAILAAADERLRPIFMTALTTICGLLPLVLLPQQGAGFDYRPLAVIVLGGLASSTVFTLLSVPLFYVFFDDLAQWGKGLLQREAARGRG